MTERIFENPQEPWSVEDLPRVARRHMDEAGADPVWLVPLSDPEYFCPENPHTDDHGFLAHSGGAMPEHVRGKRIEVKFRDGFVDDPEPYHAYIDWGHKGTSQDIIAYRIVADAEQDGPEEQSRQVPPHRSGGGGALPPPDIPEFLRHWRPRWGAEGREAGDILPRKNPALDRREDVARSLHSASGDPARMIQILSTEYIRLRALEEVLYDYDSIRAHMDPETKGRTRSMHVSDTIHAIQGAWSAMLDQENEDETS